MRKFKKRVYDPRVFVRDMAYFAKNLNSIRLLVAGRSLSPEFRERLCLVVTAVNQCRYCASAHQKIAVHEGISREEVRELLAGAVDHCPEEEAHALLYAQHWAETNGHPRPEVHEELVDDYGHETVETIELVLRMIRTGNLSGNSLDFLLHRLSAGRMGA